ncbi:MAG TPA: efflux RND transporter periplasmic adaptor subunit [Steroidobacteraceae bacterium]|nr:efflux RND transporter periplasmic adaptor subunit [Steroidobacteraceae bacterium]
MKKKIILLAIVALAAAGIAWWLTDRHAASNEIVLYGNVDLREVNLAFNDSQRIVRVLVQEGNRVRKGQVLALLDTSRLTPQLDQAKAQADAQAAVVQRLRNGSRPQEVAQARANLALAQADARQARENYLRVRQVFQSSSGRAVSRQDLDNAKAQWDVAQARVAVNRKALELAVIGPRKEDIAQAQAMLAADEAKVALLRQELADATLKAPLDAVVRSRIAEPGDMASPQKTAFTLAITDPKWVRAYVSERDLGLVRPGMAASVQVDSFPGRRFDGWVGFISPVAEFTPKTVQTPELRSSLVYQIRVFVKDPGDSLRLGMPATVYLSPNSSHS